MSEEQTEIAEGILEEARVEAERILSEWRSSAGLRRGSIEQRVASVQAESEKRIESERRRVLKRSEAQIAVIEKRARLRVQDAAYHEVERRTKAALGEVVGTKGYEQVLLEWIVEAGTGLGAEKATVKCSEFEGEAVGRVLPEAENRIAAKLGHSVALSISDVESSTEQGVELVAEELRIAYSNRVSDRLFRLRTPIRRIIHDRLFKGTADG